MTSDVKRAIDTNLTSLRVTPEDAWRLAGQIRAQAAAEPVRPRRLSAALVLAVVLTLLAAGAVAAVLLSGRDMVEQYVLPMSEQVDGNSLTAAQTEQLVALAEANGVELSENAKNSIARYLAENEGYFKEEMIMALAKAEFGQNLSGWTLEQWDWFRRMGVAVGWGEPEECGMPEGGEDAKYPIIEKATAYIREKWNDMADFTDPAKYIVGAQYVNGDVDEAYPGWYWIINYNPRTPQGNEYWLDLDLAGNVLSARQYRGAGEGRTAREIEDAYHRLYSDTYWTVIGWSQAILRDYQAALRLADENSLRQDDRMILRSEYPDIDPAAISREEAAARAMTAMGCADTGNLSAVHYIGAAPNPVWKVIFGSGTVEPDAPNGWQYAVEVDSLTGEIRSHDRTAYGDTSYWGFCEYALNDTVDAVLREYPRKIRAETTASQARSAAEAYIISQFGVEVKDETHYACEVVDRRWNDVQWEVRFTSQTEAGKGWWAWVNGYGDAVDGGKLDAGSLDDIRREYFNGLGGWGTYLCDLRAALESCTETASPVLACIRRADYPAQPGEYYTPEDNAAMDAAIRRTLGVAWFTPGEMTLLVSGGRMIWHMGVESPRGCYYIDLDAQTHDVLAVKPCDSLRQPWYAYMVSIGDMEELGLSMGRDARRVRDGSLADTGVTPGEEDFDVLRRYKEIYGPEPAQWSQAQLESYRRATLYMPGGSLDWACIAASSYPEVPMEAISRRRAGELAAAAANLTEYELNSAVLLESASHPNPVWRVCLAVPDEGLGMAGYLAEVDCLTGAVFCHRRVEGMFCWYYPLVLDETIDEMEATFEVTTNG